MKHTLKSLTLGMFSLGLIAVGMSLAQTNNVIPGSFRCGVSDVSPGEQAKVELAVAKLPPLRPEALTIIPVYMHILHRTDGVGNVSNTVINTQIQVLNDSHNGTTGGANTQFQFVLMGITRTANNAWHQMTLGSVTESVVKAALRQGVAGDLNVYICNPAGGVIGSATYPWAYASSPVKDGVILNYGCLPGGSIAPINQGDVLVHEVGHWLGLFHTSQGGCGGQGDGVTDTPDEASPAFGCPVARDTCPSAGVDPIFNFMDGTDDACMYEFTAGQTIRMNGMWLLYRQ